MVEKDKAIVLTGPINKSQIPQATVPIIISTLCTV